MGAAVYCGSFNGWGFGGELVNIGFTILDWGFTIDFTLASMQHDSKSLS